MSPLSMSLPINRTAVTLAVTAAAASIAAALVYHHIIAAALGRDVEVVGLIETDAGIASQFFTSSAVTSPPDEHHQKADSTLQTVAYDEERHMYRFQRRCVAPPLLHLNMPLSTSSIQKFAQQKEFVWLSVNNRRFHVGIAMLQFHYVGAVVLNIYDAKTGDSWKQKVELPFSDLFGFGPHFGNPYEGGGLAPSAPGHVVQFSHPFSSWLLGGMNDATVTMKSTGSTWEVDYTGEVRRTQDGKKAKVHIRFAISIPENQMSMVFPIGPHRASMVSKFAGAKVVDNRLYLVWDEARSNEHHKTEEDAVDDDDGPVLAAMDYTRGLLRRETTWFWSSFSGMVRTSSSSSNGNDKKEDSHGGLVRLGVHLSTGTYDDKEHVSYESCVFVDGVAVFVNRPIAFLRRRSRKSSSSNSNSNLDNVNTNRSEEEWTVDTPTVRPDATGEHQQQQQHDIVSIHLTFRPVDQHDGQFNYGLVKGNLQHYWGTYQGTITLTQQNNNNNNTVEVPTTTVYTVVSVPGVLEDHYALW